MVVKASLKNAVLEDTRKHNQEVAGRDRIVRLLESKTADNPRMIEVRVDKINLYVIIIIMMILIALLYKGYYSRSLEKRSYS